MCNTIVPRASVTQTHLYRVFCPCSIFQSVRKVTSATCWPVSLQLFRFMNISNIFVLQDLSCNGQSFLTREAGQNITGGWSSWSSYVALSRSNPMFVIIQTNRTSFWICKPSQLDRYVTRGHLLITLIIISPYPSLWLLDASNRSKHKMGPFPFMSLSWRKRVPPLVATIGVVGEASREHDRDFGNTCTKYTFCRIFK